MCLLVCVCECLFVKACMLRVIIVVFVFILLRESLHAMFFNPPPPPTDSPTFLATSLLYLDVVFVVLLWVWERSRRVLNPRKMQKKNNIKNRIRRERAEANNGSYNKSSEP